MEHTFSKNDTAIAKGVAIIFMLMHHLWAFPDRVPFDFSSEFSNLTVGGTPIFEALGKFGAVCVPIFMFFIGYGLYKNLQLGKLNIPRKILNVYIKYWKVFIIFIPIAFVVFGNQEVINAYGEYYRDFSLNTFVLNFLGISTWQYNGEWWFIRAFAIGTVFGYLYMLATKRTNNVYVELAIVYALTLLFYRVIPSLRGTPGVESLASDFVFQTFIMQGSSTTLFAGIVFAKYNLLDKTKDKFAKCRVPIKIVAAFTYTFVFFCLRVYDGFTMYDFILVPFFIAISTEAIASLKGINIVLEFLGKNSTNIWFVHSFFCYRFSFFVKIVYSSNEIVNLLILIALSLVTSILIDRFYCLLEKTRRSIGERSKLKA